MSLNEGTGSQPQGTQTTGEAERHSSFLGTGYQHEIVSEKEPAPTEAEQTEDAIAQVTEGTSEEPQSPEESETPTLPAWLEDYPEDVIEKFKRRYPTAFNRLSDSSLSRDDESLLRDKINDYMEIQRSRAATQEEPTLEEETPEVGQQQTVTPEQQRQEYYKSIDTFVAESIDPAAVEELGKNLLQGFGVDIASDDPDVQALVKNAPKVGMTLAKGAVDLMLTAMPSIIPNLVEEQFPGFGKMYERSVYAMTWDNVRTAEVDGQRPYENLPAYGTQEFRSVMREAARQIPDFDSMVFRDQKTGKILPMQQQAEKKYAMLARLAAGKKVAPAEVRDAVETGKRLAQRTEQTRAAGKALGAGRAKPDSAPASDDLNSNIIAAYNSRHGNSFGGK